MCKGLEVGEEAQYVSKEMETGRQEIGMSIWRNWQGL